MHSSEFDIIFAGGGATACVVAGRLISADPSLKILVVERGPHTFNVPINVQPGRFVENHASSTTTMTFHTAMPNDHLNGRAVVLPSGKCVGGGSAVNCMAYLRGAASDYDAWATLGNEGWDFTALLPFIKKLETFNPHPDQPTHGYTGPIQIAGSQEDLGIGRQFLDVAKVYDPQRPQVDDCNDFRTVNAYAPFYKYIDPKTGRRSDTASAYLYPHSQNLNLQIRVGMIVKRVIIENGRAVGIEYTADATSSSGAESGFVTVTASKLVVVSAGAFGSPAILERSGIGNPTVLNKNHVSVVVDLPGVGENYRDHIGGAQVFHLSDVADTMDDVWSNPGNITAMLAEWETNGTGKIATNGIEALMKFRPTTSELTLIGPAFRQRWESFFQHNIDMAVGIVAVLSGYLGYYAFVPPPGQKFFGLSCHLLHPDSAGSFHITSGEDVNSPSTLNTRFFSSASDVACLVALYKKAREIARRMPAYRGEADFGQPQFAAHSAAACRKTDRPVAINAPDINYSVEDDVAIEEYYRQCCDVGRTWSHALGTCSMKPRGQGGVVDSRLNVYGIEGLKVADLSICPLNISSNAYWTALLVGEKAAAIIAEDLKINYA